PLSPLFVMLIVDKGSSRIWVRSSKNFRFFLQAAKTRNFLFEVIVIMTFELSRLSERKLIKSGVFIKKVGITFYRFSENPKIPAGNAEQKVGITFFLKQI
ncbi:MAG: hypothetical protein K1W35_23655, partial [Lachnospiraceae bacterium]